MRRTASSRRTAALATLLLASTAGAAPGLVEVKSAHGVPETVARLEAALREANVTVVARVDHAAAAEKVGEKLLPAVLLVFGNPKLGTPLMQCAPTAGIDLPLKALVRQDESGKVFLAYVDPAWIAERHGGRRCEEVVRKMTGALAGFAAAATSP